MQRSALEKASDRLGWMIYLTVMGGGVLYWPDLLVPWRESEEEQPGPEEQVGSTVQPRHRSDGAAARELDSEQEEVSAA